MLSSKEGSSAYSFFLTSVAHICLHSLTSCEKAQSEILSMLNSEGIDLSLLKEDAPKAEMKGNAVEEAAPTIQQPRKVCFKFLRRDVILEITYW